MTARPRLILFDVDGTLVDSQVDILASMQAGFGALDLPAPDRAAVLGIVGLSLDHAVFRLAPDLAANDRARIVAAYKEAYATRRMAKGAQASSPLYPGVAALIEHLGGVPHYLLGVATGKSRRGLDALFASLGFGALFVTRQTADDHPSKPHPAMIHAALAETGVAAEDAVMIGDTSFDMEMARAAGVRALGVSWGYHPPSALGAAHRIVGSVAELRDAIDAIWTVPA